ncbi:MAG: heavy metal translocating P-type ATPase [Verrucomicrobiales bacterium]|jgi:Cd2+/Zn2+-exporting ATPase|nr:cadmium-translocating P-type ATPase [Verrucomicrobiae bacterium]
MDKDHSHARSKPDCCSHDKPRAADGHDHSAGVTRSQLWGVGISGAAIAAGFLAEWFLPGTPWLAVFLFACATLAGAVLILPHALESVRELRLDMNVLMVVAVIGAWAIGEGKEGAAVVFLFALAELLESWSVGRARKAIKSLLALAPETAWLRSDDGNAREVPVSSVAPGQTVLVRSGQRVPLDGVVTDGASAVNQAPITGESVPVDKTAGDPVFAGTINGEGSLVVRVSKAAGDSTLARIIRLVEEAEGQKAPTQKFVDRFARYYTPAVFVLAVLVALLPPLLAGGSWSVWGYRALVLLVIACPCALVIATPVSIVSGLTALARRGVLIKGGAFLEAVGKLRALAVDKTGTITQGQPVVAEIIPWQEDETAESILVKAAAIDTHSTHPLAEAVTNAARDRGLSFTPSDDYISRTGRGAEARIDGHPHFIGNHRMAHDLGVCSPGLEAQLEEIEKQGLSLAILGHTPHADCEGKVLGILVIGDTLRPEAPEALRQLHAAGLEKIVMLSGDNQRTASAIAAQAGIDEAQGDLLPEQKVEHIRELVGTYGHVGMIGDGVNDAPALAVATVGIAMGAAGSDTAIETADMALMNDDLRRLADAIQVGRRTVRIIQFNVAFAIAIKALFLILAFTGHTSLWLAILADTGATLLVIANALRLLRTNP